MDSIEELRSFLRDAYGILISREKDYLLTSRLAPVLRQLKLSSLRELWTLIRQDPKGVAERAFIDAVTTNETYWFRDTTVFNNLQDKILPEITERRSQNALVRIWSAACSTGQEPYSIALCLKKMELAGKSIQSRILGSDISSDALQRAREGLYTGFEMDRGLPDSDRQKFFSAEGNMWRIEPAVRSKVTYEQINLMSGRADIGQFDIIFCRNVLVYFDEDTRTQVINMLAQHVLPGGFLIFGNAERPHAAFREAFESYAPNIYKKSG